MGKHSQYSTENRILIAVAIGVCILITIAMGLDLSENKAVANFDQVQEIQLLVEDRVVGKDAKAALVDGIVTQKEYNNIKSKLNAWRRKNAR